MIRILIVDDRELICEILQTSLESQPDLQVVGRANDGKIAIEKVNSLRPDIVLMDSNMPVIDGLAATRQIMQSLPEMKIIIFSSSDGASYSQEAIKAGARKYIPKTAKTEEIIEQIRLVHHEGRIVAPVSEQTKVLQQIDRVQKELTHHVRQVNQKLERVEQTEATIKKYFDNVAQKNGNHSVKNTELKSTVEPIIIDLNKITKESKQHSTEINQIQNLLEAQVSYIRNLNQRLKKNQQYLLIACSLAGVSLVISLISLLF